MRHIISILMENEAGALSRVAGLFSARGYNIESLTVAPTEDESLSRMTLVTRGTDEIIEQKGLQQISDSSAIEAIIREGLTDVEWSRHRPVVRGMDRLDFLLSHETAIKQHEDRQ